MKNLLDKLLLLLFPFIDVGFVVFDIPLRLGEIFFLLVFVKIINIRSILHISKIHKWGLIIVSLLFVNLILVIAITSFSHVDQMFYYKYIIRNFLYFLAMICFLLFPIKVGNIDVNRLVQYILLVVSFFYVMEFLDYYVYSFNWDSVFVSRQGKNVFRNIIIRFAGPASEGGHLIPLLSIPLMYGLMTRKHLVTLCSIVFILLTFSSFGYLVLAFAIIYFFKKNFNKYFFKKALKIAVNGLMFCAVVAIVFAKKVGILINYNWLKVQAYFRVGDVTEWSASQRTNHIKLAFDLFMDSPWYNKLFGNGTGYYSRASREFTGFYLDKGSEAHSLYFSTLTDRGLVGLGFIILLFFCVAKIKIPKNINENYKLLFACIKFGSLVKISHWMFTGMVWQYYFWIEVALLISISSFIIKKTNEQ